MEDGGKEDTAKPKEVKLTGKAGWLKKSSGKIFGTYRDRYIRLEHTEIAVYEHEDLKNCLERLDLEKYDKCHELRGGFKKKNRLILIRSSKCANKVQDVKLQAQSQEDKEAWIKAFSDGINRAKNKIFDEVKIDEGCSLEHVTRSRPKGNRGRRPPTRIHMKEVANVGSDGILRLDLDTTDSKPNGTHHVNTEDSTPKGVQTDVVSTATSDPTQDESASEEPSPQKKVFKPPMPPSKQNKPVSPSEEETHGETTSDSGVDTGAPPTPCKPCSSQDDLSSDSSSVDNKPPKPPSKEMKPAPVGGTEAKETREGESGVKDKEETEDKTEEITEAIQHNEQDQPTNMDNVIPKKVLKPSVVMWGAPLVETSSEPEGKEVPEETQSTPEPLKKSSGPPAPPKKKSMKCPVKSEDDEQPSEAKKGEDNESSSSKLISDSAETETNTPSISPEPLAEVVPPSTVSGQSVEPCDLSVGKVEQEEDKSIDSGQHSAEESENGDATTTSTTVLRGSQTKLDGDSGEAEETDSSSAQTQSNSEDPSTNAETHNTTQEGSCGRDSALESSVRSKPQILSPRPLVPLKFKSKMKSISMGDLLAECSDQKEQGDENVSATSVESDMEDLQSEVTVALKNTGELLHTISDKQTAEKNHQGELTAGLLLASAMEKLRKAEEILSVAKSFKEKKAPDKERKRMSW